jgi:diacylglycerol kinase
MNKKIQAFTHAFRGLQTFFAETFHAKVHLLAAIIVSILGFWLNLSMLEWVSILICITMVFVAEAINSAIEYTVDLKTDKQHPLAKKAKDVAAAAVLLAAIFSVIIAFIIFYPKLTALWH